MYFVKSWLVKIAVSVGVLAMCLLSSSIIGAESLAKVEVVSVTEQRVEVEVISSKEVERTEENLEISKEQFSKEVKEGQTYWLSSTTLAEGEAAEAEAWQVESRARAVSILLFVTAALVAIILLTSFGGVLRIVLWGLLTAAVVSVWQQEWWEALRGWVSLMLTTSVIGIIWIWFRQGFRYSTLGLSLLWLGLVASGWGLWQGSLGYFGLQIANEELLEFFLISLAPGLWWLEKFLSQWRESVSQAPEGEFSRRVREVLRQLRPVLTNGLLALWLGLAGWLFTELLKLQEVESEKFWVSQIFFQGEAEFWFISVVIAWLQLLVATMVMIICLLIVTNFTPWTVSTQSKRFSVFRKIWSKIPFSGSKDGDVKQYWQQSTNSQKGTSSQVSSSSVTKPQMSSAGSTKSPKYQYQGIDNSHFQASSGEFTRQNSDYGKASEQKSEKKTQDKVKAEEGSVTKSGFTDTKAQSQEDKEDTAGEVNKSFENKDSYQTDADSSAMKTEEARQGSSVTGMSRYVDQAADESEGGQIQSSERTSESQSSKVSESASGSFREYGSVENQSQTTEAKGLEPLTNQSQYYSSEATKTASQSPENWESRQSAAKGVNNLASKVSSSSEKLDEESIRQRRAELEKISQAMRRQHAARKAQDKETSSESNLSSVKEEIYWMKDNWQKNKAESSDEPEKDEIDLSRTNSEEEASSEQSPQKEKPSIVLSKPKTNSVGVVSDSNSDSSQQSKGGRKVML